MENVGKKFAENLYAMRKLKGLSQQDMALQIHVSQQCVSKWESGKMEPTLTMLWRLADFFDVSVDELIGRID